MRNTLFPFQETALSDLHEKIGKAHLMWSERDPQVISFSAPTGAGKTIIVTTLFEEILYGSAASISEPDSIFIWLSDSPELNEQTRLKIESKSDKIRVRDLITIDSNFDAEVFAGGSIYFLNTQKLGSDKLLTVKSDARQYTIWETLSNTAQLLPKKLYVVIDEAHRGTNVSAQSENKAHSIMQKFVKGSIEDGLCPMPLVIGVTATPQKFDTLIAGTASTVQKIVVSAEEVRESGLIKDRVIIHYPDVASTADMTLFAGAVDDWCNKYKHWGLYCERESAETVKPVLVIQVEDGSEREATRTDLSACVDVLEEKLGRHIQAGEVVHTFNDKGSLKVREIEIQKIDASAIEDDGNVLVVFFKMNLSTGWDCPRAETMMSFRNAQDYTYIAQLLGRMVRTPLARRIDSNEELNSVSLYLPYFNEETVKNVVEALRNNEAATPLIEANNATVNLHRNVSYLDVFDQMKNLITYRIENAPKQSYVRLLVKLARAITMDGIDFAAWRLTLKSIIAKISDGIEQIKLDGEYEQRASAITGFSLDTLIFDYEDNNIHIDEATLDMDVTEFDISRHFEQAGRLLGEGLHREYWIQHSERDHIEVKIEIILFANELNAMSQLEDYAKVEYHKLFDKNKRAIAKLSDSRRAVYDRLISSSAHPIAVSWNLPDIIDFSVSNESEPYGQHLYYDEHNNFNATLNPWEAGLLAEELKNGAVCWFRNLDRKKWALQIPYEKNGKLTPMFPDLVVVKVVNGEYVFDILEPHDPSRTDNCDKAVGLAKFAEKHWQTFGRIQLIRKTRGVDGRQHFYRLDMSKSDVWSKVRGINSNDELNRIFDDEAIVEE